MKDGLIENLTNYEVFTESLKGYVENFSANSVIIAIMMIFMLVGAIDKMRGNKLGYGERFDEGFNTMGPLAIAIAGILAAVPVFSILLRPLVMPIYNIFGIDPSSIISTVLAIDMGGYSLSMEMAGTVGIGSYSGVVIGGTMGCTIIFTIPVALAIIPVKDRMFMAIGILTGLITIPLGCVAGGIVTNLVSYDITITQVLVNTIPCVIVAAVIIAAMWFVPMKMINMFIKFGNGVTIITVILTVISVFQYETGIRFPLFNTMVEPDSSGTIPLEYGLLLCGQICIVLIGAFPMVTWITRTFEGVFKKLGHRLDINDTSSIGLMTTLCNNIAMLNIFKEMDNKGMVLNAAFAVSASFVFGDYIGVIIGFDQQMLLPMIAGKLVAGFTALILAVIIGPALMERAVNQSQEIPVSEKAPLIGNRK